MQSSSLKLDFSHVSDGQSMCLPELLHSKNFMGKHIMVSFTHMLRVLLHVITSVVVAISVLYCFDI